MARNNIAVVTRLSEFDYKCLETLSNEEGLAKSEFIRMFIQTLWLARNVKLGFEKTKEFNVEYEGYGYRFSEEFMRDFVKRLENSFEGLNLDKAITVTQIDAKKGNFKRKINPASKLKKKA